MNNLFTDVLQDHTCTFVGVVLTLSHMPSQAFRIAGVLNFIASMIPTVLIIIATVVVVVISIGRCDFGPLVSSTTLTLLGLLLLLS